MQRARSEVRSGNHGRSFAIRTEHHSERAVIDLEMSSRRGQLLPGRNEVAPIALQAEPGIDDRRSSGKHDKNNTRWQYQLPRSAHGARVTKRNIRWAAMPAADQSWAVSFLRAAVQRCRRARMRLETSFYLARLPSPSVRHSENGEGAGCAVGLDTWLLRSHSKNRPAKRLRFAVLNWRSALGQEKG